MIVFNEIHYLWLLLLIPFCILLLYFVEKHSNAKRKRFISDKSISVLMPFKLNKAFPYFFIFPFFAFILALAEPRLGNSVDKAEKASLDIVLAVDLSESMLAADMYPNRLEALKRGIYALLERLKGDRIALVAFAGNAYPQMPLSSDYGSAKMFVESLNPDLLPMKGTNLKRAIEVSAQMFDNKESDNRTIFILSDGENHEDSALVQAEKAFKEGIIVNVASIGSTQGAPIPIMEDGVQTGWKSDANGQQILSAANPQFLKQVAEKGGGYFAEGNDPVSALLNLYKSTDDMPRLPRESVELRNKANRFLWLLWPGFLLMLLLFVRSKKWFTDFRKVMPLFLAILSMNALYAQHPNAEFRQGLSAYKEGNYKKSIEVFKKSAKHKELNVPAKFNLAAAYYKAGMTDSAIHAVQFIAQNADDADLKQKAWYNLGNAFLSQQNYPKAIDAYIQALKENPADEMARYNLTYALHKLKQEQQKQQKEQPQNQQQQMKQEEKSLEKNNANEEVLKLLENRELDKRKNNLPTMPVRPEKDW